MPGVDERGLRGRACWATGRPRAARSRGRASPRRQPSQGTTVERDADRPLGAEEAGELADRHAVARREVVQAAEALEAGAQPRAPPPARRRWGWAGRAPRSGCPAAGGRLHAEHHGGLVGVVAGCPRPGCRRRGRRGPASCSARRAQRGGGWRRRASGPARRCAGRARPPPRPCTGTSPRTPCSGPKSAPSRTPGAADSRSAAWRRRASTAVGLQTRPTVRPRSGRKRSATRRSSPLSTAGRRSRRAVARARTAGPFAGRAALRRPTPRV